MKVETVTYYCDLCGKELGAGDAIAVNRKDGCFGLGKFEKDDDNWTITGDRIALKDNIDLCQDCGKAFEEFIYSRMKDNEKSDLRKGSDKVSDEDADLELQDENSWGIGGR